MIGAIDMANLDNEEADNDCRLIYFRRSTPGERRRVKDWWKEEVALRRKLAGTSVAWCLS
jgi:hypothetical protein